MQGLDADVALVLATARTMTYDKVTKDECRPQKEHRAQEMVTAQVVLQTKPKEELQAQAVESQALGERKENQIAGKLQARKKHP